MKSIPWFPAAAIAALLLPVTDLSGQPASATAYDNVVIVLDASGSMKDPMPGTRGAKMDAAKAALRQVVQRIPQATRIGLLVFSASGLRDDWVHPLGPRNDPVMLQAVDRLVPYGDTPLGKYIKIGSDRLLQERERQLGYGTYRLLVITDGEAQDKQLVDRYTPEVVARGIRVDAIGVAMGQRHTLATKVHSYRAANDAEALKKALAEVLAEVGGGGKDPVDAEAFALLAPIPSEMGAAMLKALAPAGNQPIGVQVRPTPAPAAANPTAVTPPPTTTGPAPATAVSPQPAPQPAPAPSRQRSKGPGFWVIAVVVFIVIFGTRALKRIGRR